MPLGIAVSGAARGLFNKSTGESHEMRSDATRRRLHCRRTRSCVRRRHYGGGSDLPTSDLRKMGGCVQKAKWADAYKKETGVGLNYQSIGSGGGIKQIQAKTVTFGASDMP